MVDVDQLLAPLSDDAPCGEDLSYDADLAALETLIQGKAETQFSAAEEPNWKDVEQATLTLFERTKDLRVTLDLTLTRLTLEGWPGFAQGTALLRGLLERYWETFYPRLDPEDDNDPTQRVNLLATLSAPEGTFGDPMRFLERLRAAPLCGSGRLGTFSLAKIAAALDGKKPEDSGAETAEIEAAFRDTPEDFLGTVRAAVGGAAEDVEGINRFLDDTLGAGRGPNLEALQTLLREAKSRLATYAPPPAEGDAEATTDGTSDLALDAVDGGDSMADAVVGNGRPRGGGKAPGEIASREDVLAALDAICGYYDAQEPSSPVSALLREAHKLVGLSYFQIIAALTPDAAPQVRLSEGGTPTPGGA